MACAPPRLTFFGFGVLSVFSILFTLKFVPELFELPIFAPGEDRSGR